MNVMEAQAMQDISLEQRWKNLCRHDLVSGEMPKPDMDDGGVRQPWYIRIMLGFAGWLGALFLMGFFAVGFEFILKNAAVAMTVGLVLCAAAYAIFNASRNSDFMMQFGLAISMAGQGMVMIGLFNAFKVDNAALYFTALLFQLALVSIMPNVIHRFLSTLGAVYAAVYLLQVQGIYGLAHGLIAIGFASIWFSTRLLLAPALWRPIAYGLSFALLYSEAGRLFSPFYFYSAQGGATMSWWMQYGWWIGSSLVNLALLATAVMVLQREKLSLASHAGMAALGACALLCIAGYAAPGLCAALMIILVGFAVGNRLLTGIGLLALLAFISHYYYQMQSTLLVKSAVLASMAMVLVLMRVGFLRVFLASTNIKENQGA